MSGGLEDGNRMDRIASASSELMKAEVLFLTSPSQKTLNRVYESCSRLDRYEGDNTRFAQRVAEHYQGRFGKNPKEAKPETQDVAILLEGVRRKFQLESLAEIITRRTIKKRERYGGEVDRRIEELRGKISLQQAEDLGKTPIDSRTVDDIFASVSFEF